MMSFKEKKRLEIVVRCDSIGSLEAVMNSIESIHHPSLEIDVIQSGVGPINKSDLLMAVTGSRLVLGFNVTPLPMVERLCKEQGVEIRLYEVIYQLTEDLGKIANSLVPKEASESITGKAKVIALFKSGRKGIILGCQVLEGTIVQGDPFRVISAMGPIYSGKIKSLHIEDRAVQKARAGQQVGLKISNFDKAKVDDLVESFRTVEPKKVPWRPKAGIFVVS
jgi:translation initiation factor IF-2